MFKIFKKLQRKAHKNGVTLEAFNAIRKKLLRMSIISLSLTFISLAIVGTKLFYPFHMVIGLGIYTLSFIPLTRRIYLSRKTWMQYRAYTYSTTFFEKEKKRFVYALVFTIVVIAFFWVRPMNEKPFASYTNTEIQQLIADDLYQSVVAMDYLETSGSDLLALLDTEEENTNVTEDITKAFEEFLRAVAFSESLTEVHRYFANIPYRLWNDRATSFLMSYSLYAKKYEIVHRVMVSVSGNEYQKKILNQHMPQVQRDSVYNEMITRFYAPKTRLRLSGGYFYMRIFARPNENRKDAFEMLYENSRDSYSYLRKNFFTTLMRTGEVFKDTTEKYMFDRWFPIQMGIANGMGHTILTTRGKEGFITAEQALDMGQEMQPGDIMLQRRNWHLSNVGIPGFWTHAALYAGDLDTLDTYFESVFPHDGYDTFSLYMEAKLPEVYTHYKTPDTDGHPRDVIEAIEPGVVLQSLPTSANADFVVALRPNLSKTDKLLALIKAFEHVGKPYDYNFDFDTRDTLVCSELVYDAYFERLPEKQGLHLETSVVNGRKMVSPIDMAKKFKKERGTDEAEFSFVYLLRGNEDTEKATVSTEKVFLESIHWSKFSFLQD